MIIKKGNSIQGLSEDEKYGIRLVRHSSCALVGPIVNGSNLGKRARELNYCGDNGEAIEDLEVVGPFMCLHLGLKV